MKKYLIITISIVLFFSCEDKKEELTLDCAGVEGGVNICGCTDTTAINYNLEATTNDGSCYHDVLTDIDGNEYQAVQIGEQLWMKENLKVTHYNNGDEIQYVKTESDTAWSDTAWENLSTGAYGYYNDDLSHQELYGNLYNWYAVEDSVFIYENYYYIRSICPEGWHVPTDDEIKELEIYLGMSYSDANSTQMCCGNRGTNEGSKLAGRADLWNDGILKNNSEFGTSGFNLLPSGYRYRVDGSYKDMGTKSDFWSSTKGLNNLGAWYRRLNYNYSDYGRYYGNNESGYSVRCLKD